MNHQANQTPLGDVQPRYGLFPLGKERSRTHSSASLKDSTDHASTGCGTREAESMNICELDLSFGNEIPSWPAGNFAWPDHPVNEPSVSRQSLQTMPSFPILSHDSFEYDYGKLGRSQSAMDSILCEGSIIGDMFGPSCAGSRFSSPKGSLYESNPSGSFMPQLSPASADLNGLLATKPAPGFIRMPREAHERYIYELEEAFTKEWPLLMCKHSGNIEGIYREKLGRVVTLYKQKFNDGFGLVPIKNSFTDLRMDVGNFHSVGKHDFGSRVNVDSGMNVVLYEVEFVKKGRWAIFQGLDVLMETGENLATYIGQQVVLEMDGGVDIATVRSVLSLPGLIKGIQEISFMPALRLPTLIDLEYYMSKDQDEKLVFDYCNQLLTFQTEFVQYEMTIIDVEFQIDRKKLIIYAEFVRKVKFNKFVKRVYEFCKHTFARRNIRPRIFIQNKFVRRDSWAKWGESL